jgi:flagellar hook-length control protein FliK
MPIAFDPPASAPHGTLPARAGRSQEDDASALDAFAQLFAAAAGTPQGAAPGASRNEPPGSDPAASATDAPFLMLSLPMPPAAIPVPGEVRILASEKRAPAPTQPIVGNAAAGLTIGPAGATSASPALSMDTGPQSASSAQAPSARGHAAQDPAEPLPAGETASQATPDTLKARPDAAPTAASLLATFTAAHAGIDKATSAKPHDDRAGATSPLAAVTAQALPPSGATPVETVAAPAFTAGWQDETVAKLAHIVVTRNERAELKLNPAELGPVTIRVDMNADHASLTIVAASPDTRSALEQSLPQLRDLLAAQGITLGQASVHDGSAQRDPSAQPWSGAPQGSRDGAGGSTPAGETVQRILRRADRLVDVFA